MKRTTDLEREMSGRIKLNAFLEKNKDQFISYDMKAILVPYMEEKGLSKAELARRSKMSDVYLFQILSGRRKPSRDKLLGICIGMELTIQETQSILKQCHEVPLYAKDRRDAIILFGIERSWNMDEIDDALFEAGERLLT